MRIGLVSQWYDPEPGAAAHPSAIARGLAAAGHEVTVLTGPPSYPHGNVYPGYSARRRTTKTIDGVRVVRTPYLPSHNRSALRRAVSYLSFAASASGSVRVLRDLDVCLVYATPATVAVPAMLLRNRCHIPYVLYVQDLWPDSVTASGFIRSRAATNRIERILHRFCSASYQQASGICVSSPGMVEVLRAREAVGPVEVVYNWVDESVFMPAPPDPNLRAELGCTDEFIVMYAGSLGHLQSLDTAVRAMARLTDVERLRLVLIGAGVEQASLQRLADDLDVADRVLFAGSRTLQDMPGVMAAADVQLVSLRDLPLLHSTTPSKVQCMMACGLPTLLSAPGDSARLVDDADCGLVVAPDDVGSLADGIRRLVATDPTRLRELGQNGRAHYLDELAMSVGTQRLVAVLEAAAGRAGPQVGGRAS